MLDTGGAVLVVSQFTLIADTAKGNRPSFGEAAPPEGAEPVYERFCAELRALGVPVETGVFGAKMELELVNDGPVTIVLLGGRCYTACRHFGVTEMGLRGPFFVRRQADAHDIREGRRR